MERRDFLTGSVFAATAGLALDACTPGSSQLIPLLVPEETFIPGEESWTSATCFECPGLCGIEVRKIDGRLVKVEGLPAHPISRGGVCARGQALPQAMYHPDRLKEPMAKQSDGSFAPISWDTALDRVSRAANDAVGDNCFLSGEGHGHRSEIIDRFLAVHGGGRRLVHAPFPTGRAHRSLLGGTPVNYVISLGAELLELGSSPTGFARDLTELRQGRDGRRGKFVMVGPRLSLTAANADEWIPARPDELVTIARELTAAVVSLRPEDEAERAVLSEAFVASLDGIEPRANVARLAEEITAHLPAVAISPPDVALAPVVESLNTILSGVARPDATPPFEPWLPSSGDAPTTGSLEEALDDGVSPGVVLVADTNPAYSLPRAERFEQWLDGADLRVSFSSFLDETALACDLILPESMSFERYEDAVPGGVAMPMASLTAPLLVRPLYDTKSMPDALIEIARRGGHESSFPWTSYEEALEEAWAGLPIRFRDALARGGWWGEPSSPSLDEPPARGEPMPLGPHTPRRADGDAQLYVYPSTAFGDGQSAHLPYLQELSDPITGTRWGSVIEIGAARAETLAVTNGDWIEVSSDARTLRAPAHVTPGLHPDVVAIAAGQGHQSFGRYASERGINAFSLLDNTAGTPTYVRVRKVPS